MLDAESCEVLEKRYIYSRQRVGGVWFTVIVTKLLPSIVDSAVNDFVKRFCPSSRSWRRNANGSAMVCRPHLALETSAITQPFRILQDLADATKRPLS